MGEARRKAARGGAPPGAADVEALLAQARAAHERRDFAGTQSRCERVLEVSPRHAEAHHLLGLAQVESGDRDSGIEALEQAVALDPDAHAYRFNLGLALRARGDFQGAALRFSEVAASVPDSGAAHYQHAITLDALGRAAEAEAAYRRTIASAPTHVNAHCGLARALYARSAVSEAVAAQAWAIALDPTAANEGRIGYARARPGTDLSAATRRAAVEACRGTVAAGGDVAALVAERDLRVIDDFESDFSVWRKFALGRKYADPGETNAVNFPGVQTPAGYTNTAQMQRIADVLGRDIKWQWPANGAFRISFANSLASSDIHVDDAAFRPMYAGVLYLSLPEHCRGGTSFWRHRATGWACVPSNDVARAAGYVDFGEFRQRETPQAALRTGFDALTVRRDAWERVLEVPMRSNRLILYRSDYFHSISEVFGTTPDDARLVQLYFFEPL